jgi:hypothetical protein
MKSSSDLLPNLLPLATKTSQKQAQEASNNREDVIEEEEL